jgi:hypothetical protein
MAAGETHLIMEEAARNAPRDFAFELSILIETPPASTMSGCWRRRLAQHSAHDQPLYEHYKSATDPDL